MILNIDPDMMAGMVCRVYTYTATKISDSYIVENVEYVTTTGYFINFHESGMLSWDAYHNQGPTPIDFWPFSYATDVLSQDIYVNAIDAAMVWDGSSEDTHPEADLDGDGRVYYFGSGDDSHWGDNAEYEAWYEATLGPVENVPHLGLNAADIESIAN